MSSAEVLTLYAKFYGFTNSTKQEKCTSISFFQEASGSFSFSNSMYTYATHDGICIKIQWTNLRTLRTVKFTSDLYTNTYNKCHGLCFLQFLVSGLTHRGSAFFIS